MPQLPISHFPINPSTTSGSFLATILNDEQQAIFSSQSGAVAPAVALAGTLWLNTSNATNYILSMYSGSVWVQLFSFDPAVGAPVPGGQAVTSVNTRIGAVRIKELYDFTETTILASGTTDGIDLIINQDVDPTANLLGTTGRLAFDTTRNIFVGHNGTSFVPLGGGAYTQYPNQVIADLGSISSGNVQGLQFRPISSASDITIGTVPFTIPTPLWPGGTVIAIKNSGTFKIVLNDSNATASGLVTSDPVELDPGKTAQFIYDSITDRWYPSGGSGGGAGKFIPYALQVIAAAGTVTALPDKGFQFRRVSSATNITLAPAPFGDATLFVDAIVLNVVNQGANNITFPDGVATQFGLYNNGVPFTLAPGTLAAFQYDKGAERFYLIGSSASSSGGGGGSAVNDKTVVALGTIDLLPVGYQSIILTAASPVILADAAFVVPVGLGDRSRVILQGSSDTNTVTLNYSDTPGGSILFGGATLGSYYKLELEYQSVANRFVEVGRNF